MRKKGILIGIISLSALFLTSCASNQTKDTTTKSNINADMSSTSSPATSTSKILFINASRNSDGNTAKMGQELLNGTDYRQLNLIEYNINQLGQNRDGDQYEEVLSAMEQSETIVIGTPVYWHSMSGSLKTLFDRFYELQGSGHNLSGKKLYFFMQGSAPTNLSIESTEYIIQRVAAQTNMNLKGMADNDNEIGQLHNQILKEQ